MKKASYLRRRDLLCRDFQKEDLNVCEECGKKVGWRSVKKRCWRCEMNAMKARPPLYIERDVLMASTNSPT